MKSIKVLLTMMLVVLGVTANAQKTVITVGELPVQAQEFITNHFKANKVLQVEREGLVGIVKEYNVILDNSVYIEFTKKGDWTEVKSKIHPIPATIVPQKMSTYVKNQFPNTIIKQIEKKRKGYSVELSNGLDLEFSLSGDFKRIDD